MDPDIIGIIESWLNPDVTDSEVSINGYQIFCCDRPVYCDGGGVLLYVKCHHKPTEFYPTTSCPEQIWCQITVSSNSVVYIIYHSIQYIGNS